MTIRLLSLLATLNKAVKAEPPVTLALLARLKEVEEEIKQGLAWFVAQLSLILHECVNLQPAGLEESFVSNYRLK